MYYVGTQEFATIGEAYDYLYKNPDSGLTITNEPVGTASTDGGMLSTPDTSTDTTYDASTTDGWDPNAPSTNEPMEETNPTPEGMLTGGDTTTTESTAPSTFTLFRGSELGDGSRTALLESRDAEQVTAGELESYFNEDGSAMLRKAFGSFDNYLGYMSEREGLIQSGEYNIGNWNEYTGALTEDELMILEGEDLTQYGDDATSTQEELYLQQMNEQQAAYENWLNSDANDALLSKYGVGGTIYNGDGDRYRWNGSAYVKTEKQDQAGLVEYVKGALTVALGIYTGGAFSAAGLGSASSAALSNAITQAVTSGDIDIEQVLTSAAGAGLTSALADVVGPALTENIPNIEEILSTGNEAVDNVLQTMAMDAIRQGVLTGSVDMQQVLTSGAFSAAGEFVDFLIGEYGTISPEQQAEWEARINAQTEAQHQEMFNEIERQFGEGALTEALNSMDAETALMATQNLANLFEANNVAQDSTGNWVEEEVVDLTEDTTVEDTTVVDEGPMAEINNPFEGDELINGVYYNEAGFPVGVSPDATPEQILEQFVNDKNAWTTATGVSAHGLPPEAVAILAQSGDLQAVSDLLVSNGLVLAMDSSGGYMLISGAESTTGFHTSIDQDALLNLEVSNETFVPPPTYSDPNLAETDASNITQEIEDLLTDVQTAPQVPAYDMSVETTVVEADPTDYEYDPTTTDPIDPTVVDQPPVDTTGGDAGTATDVGTGITVEDVTAAVNDAINQIETGATAEEVQTAIDTAVNSIDIPAGMTAEEVQQIVNEAVNGIDIPAGMTPEQVQEIVNTAMTGVATQADIDAAVQDLQTQISNLPAGATAEEVQTAIDTAIAGIEFPAGLSAEDVQGIVDTAVGGITFPESVTADEMSTAITEAVSGLATQADIEAAIGAIEFPESATSAEVQEIVDEAIAGIQFPEGLTTEQVQSIVDTAVGGIEFPAGLSAEDVQNIVTNATEGYATSEAVNTAIDAAVGTINETIAGLNNLSTTDVGTIVNEAIGAIEFPESVTDQQMQDAINTAIGNITFPEGLSATDVADIVAASGFATPENVAQAVANAGYATPEDVASAIAAAGYSTPEDVAAAVAAAGFSTPEDVATAIANAGLASPEDVAEAIAAAGYATPEDIANAVSQAGYATPEDVASAIASAGYVNPEDLATALENSGFATADSLATAQQAIDENMSTLQQDLLETLATMGTDQETNLSDAEARLLESISGVEADVLLELSNVEGGLEQAIADMDVNFNEALSEGLEATQTDLMEALEAYNTGQGEALSAAEARLLETITGGDAATLQAMSDNAETFNQALADLGLDLEGVQTTLGDRIGGLETDVSTGFETAATERQELMDALTALETGAIASLTEGQADLLAEITGGDAATLLALSQTEEGLQSELDALGTDLGTVQETLAGDISALEESTSEQFGEVGEQIEGVETSLSDLFNQGLESVGGDINALAEQSLGYYNSLQESLTAQSEGFTTELGDTEARLLENMTGIEAGVLQELAAVEGGLEGALGDLGTDLSTLSDNVTTRIGDVESAMGSGFQGVADQFGQVQGDIAGLGAGIEGLGQGVAGIGAGLLQGLGALGGEQRRAAAMASAPKWKDFYSGDIGYGNRPTYGMLNTQQQSATDPLTQLISRSLGKSGMLS